MSVLVYLDPRAPRMADAEAPRDPPSIYRLANPFRPNTSSPTGPGTLATEQWRFLGRRLGLTGFNGTTMAPNGDVPGFGQGDNSQSVILPATGNHQGLDTGIAEKASETWVIVFRMLNVADPSRDILGNLTATSTDGGWGLIHQSGVGLRVSTRASSNSLVTLTLPGTVVPGAVCALAIAHQSSSRKYRFRGGSSTTTSLARRLSSPVLNIALGEIHNANSHSGAIEVFSLTAFAAYLSDADMDVAMANDKAALAANSVKVV